MFWGDMTLAEVKIQLSDFVHSHNQRRAAETRNLTVVIVAYRSDFMLARAA